MKISGRHLLVLIGMCGLLASGIGLVTNVSGLFFTPLMRTVQKRMEECVELLRRRGCSVDFVLGPGNHLQHIPERYEVGLRALDKAL